MQKPNYKQAEIFWEEMCSHYGTSWKYKKNAWEAKVIGKILASRDIVTYDNWMNNYSTILGRTIYIPFVPGEASDNHPAEKQISSCTHEHQHWNDACDRGKLTWNWEYLISSEKRAVAEALGYKTNIEMYHWFTGKIIPTKVIVDLLAKTYKCGLKDVLIAKDILDRSIKLIERGDYTSPATVTSLEILNRITHE